ncbi:hypothetical protein [Dactylosporangium darangshiense]|uniref:Uncharacterized protein n=1 Tax=Dactylosporangium darangshiense TaxID=579108 RepID=A0ABP8DS23_9ACTN
MTKTDNLGVPRVDEAVDLDTIRDEAEDIAVPAFDYIAQPIEAMVDGLTGHAHHENYQTDETQVDHGSTEGPTDKSVEMSEHPYCERRR